VKALSSPRDSSVSRKLDAVEERPAVAAKEEEEEEEEEEEKARDERVSPRLVNACARAVKQPREKRAVAR
jgi:hypothetical protein